MVEEKATLTFHDVEMNLVDDIADDSDDSKHCPHESCDENYEFSAISWDTQDLDMNMKIISTSFKISNTSTILYSVL